MPDHKKKVILVTGGARSGKSDFAQELAGRTGQAVLFVATAEEGDEEMRHRIEKHRRARPAHWTTLEVTAHIGQRIEQELGEIPDVLIDCITLLVNNVMLPQCEGNDEAIDASLVEEAVTGEIEELIQCIDRTSSRFIIVTNDVGLGLVPANKLGRVYRDVLGRANQKLARRADEVYLLVAGIPVKVKPAAS